MQHCLESSLPCISAGALMQVLLVAKETLMIEPNNICLTCCECMQFLQCHPGN